ncbi:MAG: TonB-dependent receptor [Bacteroidaceae bacterium]
MKHFKLVGSARLILTLIMGLFLSLGAYGQQFTVKGNVKDKTGLPIIGANVVVKGATTGTITDLDGNYQLRANKGDVLEFSFVGYKSQEFSAAPVINVILNEDAIMLEGAVVIGYGKVKKEDLTGSVTAIQPDKLNHGLTTNAQDMMTGKIAGVSVINNGGAPGTGATIRIRGGSSLNASNDPLIVIDGLAMDNEGVKGLSNPLSMVNPNDIETFTVLKDASATAIYGSRASNGVIIITTKRGKAGQKAHVTYNGNVSMGMVKETLDVMNANEYRAMVQKEYGEGSTAMGLLGNSNTDWQDLIYRDAWSSDHNITITGGLANMPYRFSVGYTNQNGIIETSNFERYTFSGNVSPSFLDNSLKVNANAKMMYAKNRYADGGAVGNAASFDPTQSPYDSSSDAQRVFGGYFQWPTNGASFNDPTWPLTANSSLAPANPVAQLEQRDDRAVSRSFVGNVEADYALPFLTDLHLHVNMGADYSSGRQHTTNAQNGFSNNYYGYLGFSDIDKYNLSFSSFAQYNKEIGIHRFDIMGGYEWQHFHREGNDLGYGIFQSTNTVSPNERYQFTNVPWATENYLVSFFGRLNYTLMNRYLFTATVRRDGSSRFNSDNRWGTFPSFAFGWKLNEEGFLKDVDWLSDLKLRLGYGETGQQNFGSDYAYFASYQANKNGAYYPIGIGDGSTSRPDAYNPDLKWERTITYNAGVDFGILNGRFTASIDAYYRKTEDLLNYVYVSAGTNFKNQVNSNIGSLENRGLELSLNLKPIVAEDFTWDLGFNATYNDNEITELTASGDDSYYVPTGGISIGTGSNIQAHAVNQAASSFFVYQQVYDKSGKPIENTFVDRNGDGIMNDDDRYFYKKPTADVLLGLNSKFTYKQWDLGFSMRASLNNYVYNEIEANNSNIHQLMAPSEFMINRAKMVLDNDFYGVGNYFMSDYYVQNASFLKLDNITLGYTFKDIAHTGIGGRVYGTVQNVLTVTDYKGLDPEISGGIDNNLYPRPFTSIIGLSLNF